MRALFAATVLLLIVFVNAQTKGPIQCYICNSLTKGQENCASSDETALKPYLKTCSNINQGQLKGRSATMCRKILQEVHEQEGVIRECAYTGEDELDGKRRIGNKGIILYLYQCENENGKACNSASSFSTFVALASALFATVMAKMWS
ncbi:hypothetical protein M3Y97_00285500 [Aphelenchoides bicaudatus]|nr:hypothetical protein M3Y97_00285500 [Aphelenchoides bicaudatus]